MHFNSSYDQKEFLRILQTKICPNFVQDIQPMQFDRQTKYFVKDSIYQLGKIKFADDTEVMVMEVQQTSINDPRITLTKDAFKILHDHQKDNALIVFHSADTDSWRLSLLTSKFEGWDKINSNAKRYSFLLGSHEKVKTPNDYLIKKGIVKDLPDLISRFDVEVVRKEFFKQYLNLFLELYKELKIYESAIGKDNDLVTFTKTLMGKIIFLYFIQKKGRLGVETDKHWGHGKKDFIKFLFDDYKGPRNLHKGEVKCSFYNDYLEPLFYEALSNERTTDVYERFGLKIPYLNGGLFEQKYDRKNTFVNPKDEIFENIIDVFDRYNFTIHEDDPYDREVAVDPEMLGKIFETMISVSSDNIKEICDMYEKAKAKSKDPDKIISVDVGKELNKKFGAFYTPREIVHYMTKESLTYYLINGIKEARPNESDEQIEKIIRELFRLKDDHLLKEETKLSQEEFQLFEQYIILTNDLLKKIKVLDPAVGSGAFPMGILHEIFGLRRYLIDAFELKFESDYDIKKSIIQNNIYGVDIEPGAIDIARLRFWLSLVVDADKPEPLPNLDFKFVCANTLIPLEESRLFTSHDVIEELNQIQKQYFNCQSKKEKEELKKKFEQTKLKFWGAEEGKRTFNTTKEYKQHIAEIAGKATDLRNKQIMNWDPFDTKKSGEFFDSELMFGIEGFSICIGNPPYLRIQGIRDTNSSFADKLVSSYKSATGSFDLYAVFLEKSLALINANGVVEFIMPTKRTNAAFGEGLRGLLSGNSYPNKIISFEAFHVFNASTYTGIQQFIKNSKNLSYLQLDQNLPTNDELGNWINNIEETDFNKIDNSDLNNNARVLTDKKTGTILEKLNQQKYRIKDLFEKIFQGIATGKDSIFFLSKINDVGNGLIKLYSKELNQEVLIEEQLLRPLLKGDQVHRYQNIRTDFMVLFPYYLEGAKYKLYEEDILKEKFPLGYDYFKKNECVLRGREKNRYDNNHRYQFGRNQGINYGGQEKIICPDISLGGNFALDNKGEFYSTTTLYGYIKKKGISLENKYLMAVLNSSVCRYFLSNTGTVLSHGYFRYKPDYIKGFPVPDVDNESQISIISIVDQILAIKKEDPKIDTSELERQIDQMVYKLYGLTDEEVKVVEEGVGK